MNESKQIKVESPPSRIAVSEDGRYIALVCSSSVAILDLSTPDPVLKPVLKLSSENIDDDSEVQISWSHSRLLFTVSKALFIFDPPSWSLIHQMDVLSDGDIECIASFDEDVYVADDNGNVFVTSTKIDKDGTIKKQNSGSVKLHDGLITGIVVTKNKAIVTCGTDRSLIVSQQTSTTPSRTLKEITKLTWPNRDGLINPPLCMSLAVSDSGLIACGLMNGTIGLCDVDGKLQNRTIKRSMWLCDDVHGACVNAVLFTKYAGIQDDVLVTGGNDNTVKLWTVSKARKQMKILSSIQLDGKVNDICKGPNSEIYVVDTESPCIHVLTLTP